jgi:Family of unknown function (DUF6223)
MKRIFTVSLAVVVAAALFGGLVYAVLVVAHVSEPAAATVYGLTLRRLWATAAAAVALVGVVIGGVALARSATRFGTTSGRLGATVALVAGLVAVVNGGLNVAMATGGPGTGNGVVGGAAAFVLGLIALILGARTYMRLVDGGTRVVDHRIVGHAMECRPFGVSGLAPRVGKHQVFYSDELE